MPILTTRRARTSRHQFLKLRVNDVLPIGNGPRLSIYMVENILIDRFLMPKEFTTFPVKLPQDPMLTGTKNGPLGTHVNQDALIYLIEVQTLARHVLKMPVQRPIVRSDCNS